MDNLTHKKLRILYLGDLALPPDPWTEESQNPPKNFEVEFHSLLDVHRYNDSRLYSPVRVVLIDLDLISHTKPLDEWALTAWRSTFNDLLSRLSSNENGSSPRLVGFTRNPNWQNAKLGVQLGARDITPIRELSPTLLAILGITDTTAATPLQTALKTSDSATIVKFPTRDTLQLPKQDADQNISIPQNELPTFQNIARHTIPFPIDGLDGNSHAIEGVKAIIRRAAPIDTSILIVGPTGSGKELVAKSIHKHSSRFANPFVVVHCASLNTNLIESELFGHMKGAFTDATQDKVGLLYSAHHGTLFLDEISALEPDVQSKLLRVLSDRKIFPVGASESLDLDVRVISATQINPGELVEQGRLREDLLFRLRVIEIALPSLNERRSDIPAIANTFLKKISKRHKRPVLEITDAIVEKLLLYKWPGNVRELENVLEHACTLAWAEARQTMELNDLPESVRFSTMTKSNDHDLKEAVKRFEKEFISATVRRLGGSKEDAAEVLGLSLATLYRKLGS